MNKRSIAGAFACVLVLLFGFTGRMVLASLKKPPAQVESAERSLLVTARTAVPEDVPVKILGTGEVRTLNEVSIAPEVSGQIVEIHPRLEVGEVIPKGETLFQIDPRTYQARLDETKAVVAQAQAAIDRWERQYTTDQSRLKTLERSRDLGEAEYNRRRELMEQDQVGTQSGVDQAEQAYNAARDAYDSLSQAVQTYPMRLDEARASLSSAQAAVDTAAINLERTKVVTQFDARIKDVNLELGQYVAPGGPVLTLADDSVLEITVPLDSREARQWLRFGESESSSNLAWFNSLEPVTCTIRWTEEPDGHCWDGTLDRVESFNQDTRTMYVAVRVDGAHAFSGDADRLPLVEGMFCSVEIPGRVASGVYRVPTWAVSYDGKVFKSVNGRLKTVPVEVSHTSGEDTYISKGIESGDTVITTRLTNPLENTLLEVQLESAEAEHAS